jgi:hypothetical protein
MYVCVCVCVFVDGAVRWIRVHGIKFIIEYVIQLNFTVNASV